MWNLFINGIFSITSIVANAIIINVIGNNLLSKSKKELQQMQQEHEKEIQQRQQKFEAFLISEKDKKEQLEKDKKEKQEALNNYCDGISKFLSYTYDNNAFAQATGAYMNILKYAHSSLHKKINDLNDLIIKIYNTYDSYDGNGSTIDNRKPLIIRASNLFAQICQELKTF